MYKRKQTVFFIGTYLNIEKERELSEKPMSS
jgi:hypothetical protein